MPPTITFLTDFGTRDDFVGVCHGVIKRIAPDAEVIDITHGIAPQAVTQGALILARSVPYMPAGIHLAVVDPGVGGDRRAIAIRTRGGQTFVGPDNGLLSLAAPAGEIETVRELTNPGYHLPDVSKTFHARDLFAPVAAHLAAGIAFDDVGEELDPGTLVRIELPAPETIPDGLLATVLAIDRFGNLQTNLVRSDIEAAGLSAGDRVELVLPVSSYFATIVGTFADTGPSDLILYEDSYGSYAVAISSGDASKLTEADSGDVIRILKVAPSG